MEAESIRYLRSDDRLKIKELYNLYRSEFIGFGKRYSLSEDDLVDIYQEAFIALRKRAIDGKLNEVQSSMKTYLFGIGKYMIFDKLKADKKTVKVESVLHIAGEQMEEIEVDETPPLSREQELLRKYFKQLEDTCRQLLTLFYYRGLSINEIANLKGYKSANVVKASKSRCLKTLRELINS